MNLEDIQTVAVIGSGIMGHGIAQSFMMSGYTVMLHDLNESILETAITHIKNMVQGDREFTSRHPKLHRAARGIATVG